MAATMAPITDGYFESIGTKIVKGRTITEQDNDTRKSNLAVAKAQLKAREQAQSLRR